MADNQIVQIDFKFDLGNVPASSKAFSKYLKDLGVDLKITKASTDALAASVSHLATAQTKAAQASTVAGNVVKKSNQQWTNLALVVQDLPYGFRGIQNNLPALVGGFAGMTGGLYFAASAVIAFFTAWDNGTFGATKSTNEWRKTLKETNDELRNTLNYTNGEVSNLQGLISVMTDVNSTESLRKKALQEVKEAITKVDEEEGKKVKGLYSAIIAVNLYTEAIQQQQMQEVIGKKIAEISLAQIEKRNTLAIETAKANRGIHPMNFFMGNTELDNLQSEIIANETLLRQMEDLRTSNSKALLLNPYSKNNAKGQTGAQGAAEAKKAIKQQQKVNEELLQNKIEAKRRELSLFKDDAWKEYQVSVDVANLQKQLELLKLKDSEYNAKQKAALEIGINKTYADELLLADQALQIQLLNNAEKVNKKKKKDAKAQFDEEKKIGDNQIKVIESQLGVQEKLHKDNLIQRQIDIEQAMAKTAILASATFGTGAFAGYLDFYDKLKAKLEGLNIAALRGADAMKQVNSIISEMATNSVVLLGESIGKALGGESVDLFGGFLELLSSGLQDIGKALITYGMAMDAFKKAFTNPYAAIAAGVALVIAGSLLKSKISKTSGGGATPFASGGIVSGPTMGLIGEYPGAKSNPEVVAPLDKLKDMLGGNGGGQFILKGNDLVLALNRSETSLNLRRGS